MVKKILTFVAIALGVWSVTSCGSKVGPVPAPVAASQLPDSCSNTSKITYSNQVSRILATYCTSNSFGGCHGSRGGASNGNFTTYSGLVAMPKAGSSWIATLKDRISPNPTTGAQMPSSSTNGPT